MADKDQAIHFCIGVLGGISSTLRGQSSDKCRETSETIDLGIEGIRELVDSNDSMKENPCEGCTNRKGCITCENGELRETEQEEPVSKDLDYLTIKLEETIGTSPHSREAIKEYLQKAAEWQKQQMMKYAVNCIYYGRNTYGLHIETTAFRNLGVHNGDEVKLIIIKK